MTRYQICRLLALSTLLSLPSIPQAAETGEQAVEAKPKAQAHSHRGPKKLMLSNAQGAKVTLWKPDLTTQLLEPEHGAFTLPKTGMDNYHAIVAEKDWGGVKEAVIRYEYTFGPPSKRSPSELAAAVKTEFEIVPDPIPREHYRYHADQTWGFILRLHGDPVAKIPVIFESENGSRLEATSDQSGRVSFHIPDDFPDIVEGERDRRSAAFAITAETSDDGIEYQTMLTSDYRMTPSHWKSTELGLLVAGIGLITGGLIGRVRKEDKK
jgi:hypothetical protein